MSINNYNGRCCPCGCGCQDSCCNGIGQTGPQGPQGPQGPRGATGATGKTGPQGMAATISVESSASVPFDVEPSVVNVGTPQAAILRFSIPEGKQGPQGKPGISPVQAYGQLVSIISNADLLKDIPTQIPLPMAGKYDNIKPARNTLTIEESGCYLLNYAMFPSLILTASYADLFLTLRKNQEEIPYTARTVRSTVGTHPLEFYGSTLVWLDKGDVIDATFKCNEDGKVFFGIDNISTFLLTKVS